MYKFYIDFDQIRKCYPFQSSKGVVDFGVLEEYKDRLFSLEEINAIIAELIIKTPYVNNSMFLHINFMYVDNGCIGYHHIIEFKNHDYKNQSRGDNKIKFLNP